MRSVKQALARFTDEIARDHGFRCGSGAAAMCTLCGVVLLLPSPPREPDEDDFNRWVDAMDAKMDAHVCNIELAANP